MRQVFFLLSTAMFVAFSLSWASPIHTTDGNYAIPDQVRFPSSFSMALREKVEIAATVTLKDSCESVDRVDQEIRGQKVIFSIRLQQKNDDFCLQQKRTDVSVNVAIDRQKLEPLQHVDIYFREDEENLRYFGAIEMKEELLSKY